MTFTATFPCQHCGEPLTFTGEPVECPKCLNIMTVVVSNVARSEERQAELDALWKKEQADAEGGEEVVSIQPDGESGSEGGGQADGQAAEVASSEEG